MKIDLHTHCLPVSKCAHHEAEQLPEIFLEQGVQAIVLTNHCYPKHCDRLSADLLEQARLFLETFHRCRMRGQTVGVKVFFGAEIKLIHEPNCPEFLLYGLSEQDFVDSYPLYNCSQKELFDFCNQKDVLMVQAHPYRSVQGYAPADMRYVHGIEVYNPHHSGHEVLEISLRLARQNGKRITAGSDFHDRQQAGNAGIIGPDTIEDQFMLRDYLREKEITIFGRDGILELI